MKKFELKKGGSMIKKIFTTIVMILVIIYIFTNKSDAANFQKYKEVNFNDYGIVKVAEDEDINQLQNHTNEGQANSLMDSGTVTTHPGEAGN
jgi:peptidoglycan hydrolase CwlO-like protein